MKGKHGASLLLASLLAVAPVPWMVSDAEFAAFLQSHASVDSSIGKIAETTYLMASIASVVLR